MWQRSEVADLLGEDDDATFRQEAAKIHDLGPIAGLV